MAVGRNITPARAYGIWLLGMLLGIFGLHRFYLRQYVRGIVISAPFIIGLVMLFYNYAQFVANTFDSALLMLSSSGGNFHAFGELQLQQGVLGLTNQHIAFVLMGVGIALFILEAFLIPRACRRYQRWQIKQWQVR